MFSALRSLRPRVLLSMGTIPLLLGIACTGKTLPFPGALMLSVQTDLSAPKDVAAVGLFITSDGRPIFSDTRDVAPNGEVRFPATIAIVADEARPRAQIKIRVVAFQPSGDVRVLRDILTTIPKGRTALLRAPLLWINEGSGKGSRYALGGATAVTTNDVGASDGFGKLTSACPDGQTFIEGSCADATVDADALPDYDEKAVFGGGSANGDGRCFDVLACFGAAAPVTLDPTACTATSLGVAPTDPSLSFAVKLPPSANTGECRSDGCLVPLDKGSGWKPEGAGVSFPKAICARITSGAALGIVRTMACPSKDLTVPSCGAASRVQASSAPPGLDGGGGTTTPVNDDFESLLSYGGEPALSAVAIDGASVYLGRTLANPPPSGVVKLPRADVLAQKPQAQVSVLFGYSAPQASAVRIGPKGATSTVLVRGDNGEVRLCTPTSANDCPTFNVTGARDVIALGPSEAYVFGSTGAQPGLFAIPLSAPALQARVVTATPVTAMTFAESRLFFAMIDGSIQQCTLPCADTSAMSQILSPPPNGPSIVTAMTADDRVPGKLFIMRVPADGVTVAAGGIFSVSMAGQGEQAIAPGSDVLPPGAPPVTPPSALAVDSTYVYWGGSYNDPQDNSRKAGLVRKAHASTGPSSAFVMPGSDPVASVAVDDNAVFWAYTRPDSALVFAKKKRVF